MEPSTFLIICLVGLFAGFINVIVGSGSSVTVPFLVFLGIPPHVAVGTNRFAMLFNNFTGAVEYHRKKYLHVNFAIIMGVCAMAGAVLGAWLVLKTTPAVLKQVIGAVLIFEIIVLLFNNKKMGLVRRAEEWSKNNYIGAGIFGFVAGIYGGFLGMAITSILMFFLVLLFRCSFLESASIAKVGAFCISLAASVVFILSGNVAYPVALTLIASYVIGAYVGVNSAIKLGDARVRYFFLGVLAVSAFLLFVDFGIKI